MAPSALEGREEEALAVMRKGDLLGKYGRQGTMKTRTFALTPDGKSLEYRGKGGHTQLPLLSVTQLSSGRETFVFRSKDGDMYGNNPERFKYLASISFSLHYDEPDGTYRTLDLQCLGNERENRSPEQQFILWYHGLGNMISVLRTGEPHGAPATPPAPLNRASLTTSATLGASLRAKLTHQSMARSSGGGGTNPFSHRLLASGSNIDAATEYSVSDISSVPDTADFSESLAGRGAAKLTQATSARWRAPQSVAASSMGASGTSSQWVNPFQRFYSGISAQPASTGEVFFCGLGPHAKAPNGASVPDSANVLQAVPETAVSDVAQVASCTRHIAFLTRSGDVHTWGPISPGEPVVGPSAVPGLTGYTVLQVACSQGATIALALGGKVVTWGKNASGCLGRAGVMSQHTPMVLRNFHVGHSIEPDAPCRLVAAGPYHCAAVTEYGQLFTWGDGAHGRLGHGTMDPSPEPQLVASLQHRCVVTVSCGYYHTAAVCQDASDHLTGHALLQCSNEHGSNGHGYTGPPAADSRRYLYTWGAAFEAADTRGGLLYSSNEGCLGLPGLRPHEGALKPHAVELGDVQAVACGLNFTIALDRDGTVFQMGSMLHCGVTDGAEWEAAVTPTRVRGALDGLVVTNVSAGRAHAVASAAKDGGAWSPRKVATLANRLVTWGDNTCGQLGRDPPPDASWADVPPGGATAVPLDVRLAWVTPEMVADRQGAPVRHCAASAGSTYAVLASSAAAAMGGRRARSARNSGGTPGPTTSSTRAAPPLARQGSPARVVGGGSEGPRPRVAKLAAGLAALSEPRPPESMATVDSAVSCDAKRVDAWRRADAAAQQLTQQPPAPLTTAGGMRARMARDSSPLALQSQTTSGQGTDEVCALATRVAQLERMLRDSAASEDAPQREGSKLESAVQRELSTRTPDSDGMSTATSTTQPASSDVQHATVASQPHADQEHTASHPNPYQAIWQQLPNHKGRPPEVCMSDSPHELAVPPQIKTRVKAEFREVEKFLTLADDTEHLQAQMAKLKRDMETARSEAAEEREARKAAEQRAMELRLRLADLGGAERSAREAPQAPEGGGGEAAAAAAAARGVQRYRSLVERNPCMVDSFWIPVDEGVMARLDVAEYSVLAKLKFSSRLFHKESVSEWYRVNSHRIAVGKLIDTLDVFGTNLPASRHVREPRRKSGDGRSHVSKAGSGAAQGNSNGQQHQHHRPKGLVRRAADPAEQAPFEDSWCVGPGNADVESAAMPRPKRHSGDTAPTGSAHLAQHAYDAALRQLPHWQQPGSSNVPLSTAQQPARDSHAVPMRGALESAQDRSWQHDAVSYSQARIMHNRFVEDTVGSQPRHEVGAGSLLGAPSMGQA